MVDDRDVRGEDPEEEPSPLRRFLAAAALAGITLLTGLLLLGGDDYEITAEFENASQVVEGAQVVVGGHPAGSVSEIELGPSGAAVLTLTIDDQFVPLPEGTTAEINVFSLSGVANRQVQLILPPDSEAGAELADGATLPRTDTVSAVDLDQIFATLDEETVADFKRVIQGLERSYEGIGEQANRGLRAFNPFLSTSRRLFAELTADDQALERLLLDTDRFSGALAARSGELSALVGNLNRMMGAIGDRKQSLAAAVRELPDFMRRANTTFVNLRAALEDLDPLVAASIPAVERLRPFLPELRAAAADAVPTFTDLAEIIRRPGDDNDLVELTRLQVPLRERAIGSGYPDCGPGPENPADLAVAADDDFTQGAFGEALCSLANGHPQLEFFRPYTTELVGWFDTFSHVAQDDALGGVGRIGTTLNTFSPSVQGLPEIDVSGLLEILQSVVPAGDVLGGLTTGYTERCPVAQERPLGAVDPEDDSVPFTDGGHLTDGSLGHCDPTQVPPGP